MKAAIGVAVLSNLPTVMAGLVPAIHDFLSSEVHLTRKSVDGRHKAGHDAMGRREGRCHA
jgi:hypothetical protein